MWALVACSALLAVGVAISATLASYAWIDRTFPGFVLLDNRMVASVGLPHWSGTAAPDFVWWQVVAVDGEPVHDADGVYAHAAASPSERAVTYSVVRADKRHDVSITTQRFTGSDWWAFFFPFLFNGVVTIGCGVAVWLLGKRRLVANAFLSLGTLTGFFLLGAADWYGPARFAPLAAVTEALLAGGVVHLALVFPEESRFLRWRFLGYAACLPVLVLKLLYYDTPTYYVTTLNLSYGQIGVAALLLATRLLAAYRSSASPLARQRARLVAVGTVLGIILPGLILTITVLVGGRLQSNLGAFFPVIFAVAVSLAIVRHDLFEIDALVKRGTYYVVLSGVVAGLYLLTVFLFHQLLRLGLVGESPLFPLLFTLVLLLVLNPLRSRLQSTVDRVFFGARFDVSQELALLTESLSRALTREQVVALVCACIDRLIPNSGTQVLDSVPLPLHDSLRSGRVVSMADSLEQYSDLAAHDGVKSELAAHAAELAIGLQREGQLIGTLLLGRKRSGLFYTASEAEFLRALAHSAAIALQNASSYQALADLNANLEKRVRDGSAQLAQAEKMASLGRLVAGVAHEINNPVSFVAGSVELLRERLDAAAAAATPEGQAPLHEAEELLSIMARGAERTAAIVRDLRTFSRVDEEARKPADLHEGLEVSLRLLHGHWKDRIDIHRDYATLPPVECDAGQINQVFMNLLSNACDAIPKRGNLWLTTRSDGERVHISIRDDGAGMNAEVASRVFDPFFTTKRVGDGTGLGLAISHGIVAAHGGRIWLESEPGKGTTFHVELPVHAAARPETAERHA